MIEFQQERVGYVHLQLAQVPEGRAQILVRFLTERHCTVISCESVNVGDKRIHPQRGYFWIVRMDFEGFVNSVHVGYLTGLKRQVVAHEAIEVGAVGLLPKGNLHRPPMVFVELGLVRGLQVHQNKVADQVSLAQRAPGRIHALED